MEVTLKLGDFLQGRAIWNEMTPDVILPAEMRGTFLRHAEVFQHPFCSGRDIYRRNKARLSFLLKIQQQGDSKQKPSLPGDTRSI